jgi:hypothetical protein
MQLAVASGNQERGSIAVGSKVVGRIIHVTHDTESRYEARAIRGLTVRCRQFGTEPELSPGFRRAKLRKKRLRCPRALSHKRQMMTVAVGGRFG